MDIQAYDATSRTEATPRARGAGMPAQAAVGKKQGIDALPNGVAAQQPAQQPAPSEQQVSQALRSINDLLESRSPNLEFSVDKDSNRTVIKVVDKDSREVIRQMPTEEALQIAKALDRLQSMLIRETA